MNCRFYLCLSVVIVSLLAFNHLAFGEVDTQESLRQQWNSQEFQRDRNEQHDMSRVFDNGRDFGRDLRRTSPKVRGGGRAGAVVAVLATCAVGCAYIYTHQALAAGACVATIVVILFFLGVFSGYVDESFEGTVAADEPEEPPFSDPMEYPLNDESLDDRPFGTLDITLDFD